MKCFYVEHFLRELNTLNEQRKCYEFLKLMIHPERGHINCKDSVINYEFSDETKTLDVLGWLLTCILNDRNYLESLQDKYEKDIEKSARRLLEVCEGEE